MNADNGSRSSWQAHAYHMNSIPTESPHSKETAGNYIEERVKVYTRYPAVESSLRFQANEKDSIALGSTELYENGKLRYIPVCFLSIRST